MNNILHPYELGKELGKHIYLENLVKIRRDRKDLPQLIEQAKSFATDLRQMEQDKLSGKIIQNHSLEDYCSKQKISQLYKITDTFGITESQRKKGDKPATDFMNEEFGISLTDSIETIINSKIINYKDNIYAIGFSNKIDAVAGIILPTIMGSACAWGSYSMQRIVTPNATIGEMIGIYAFAGFFALVSIYNAFFMKWHFKDCYEKNPFNNLAKKLENSVDSLEKQMKETKLTDVS
jgi:thiaminase